MRESAVWLTTTHSAAAVFGRLLQCDVRRLRGQRIIRSAVSSVLLVRALRRHGRPQSIDQLDWVREARIWIAR